ncbi:MAG: class I adenylate-forming enzyme family protein [Acidimicrobiales bacterium]
MPERLESLVPPFPPTIPAVLAEAVSQFAAAPFLLCGPERLTFEQAEEESARLALGLLSLGVGKGTRVGILMPNSPTWVVCYLAAARIGALTVPISTLSQAPELAWVLKHSDVQILLTVDRYLNHDYVARLESIPGLGGQPRPDLFVEQLPYLRHVVVWGDGARPWTSRGPELLSSDARVGRELLAAVEAQVAPADDLMIVYTSGSTLEPKAVVHTHASAIRLSYALQASGWGDIRPGDRIFSPAPFFWIGGHNCNVLPAMFTGACVVMSASPAVDDIIDAWVDAPFTTVLAAAATLKAIEERAAWRGVALPSVRLLMSQVDAAGDPIPRELIPNMLGMTETFGPHGVEPRGTRLPADKAGAFGRSLPGIERKVVDPETGKECPPGEAGELYVRGFSLTRGLYKRLPEDVFDADGFYPTGDRCRIDDDGFLYFEGRYGDMIKTHGANVSPREVEASLEACAEIREAAVFGIADAVRGESIVAVVVPSSGANLDPARVLGRLRDTLSHFKVPHYLVPMDDADIPRTDTGKVNKRLLKELVRARWDEIAATVQ